MSKCFNPECVDFHVDMHTYMHLHRTMVQPVASATSRAGCSLFWWADTTDKSCDSTPVVPD